MFSFIFLFCQHKILPFSDSNTQVGLYVEELMEDSDYTLQFNLGTLNVNSFLAKFGVDASEMIGSDLSFARSRLGLATLIMQEPKVDGLFSPGGGFEIVATGTISAPQLVAEASKFYLIVQDFKEGSSESVNDGFSKPIAAIFALYSKQTFSFLCLHTIQLKSLNSIFPNKAFLSSLH